MSSNIVNFSIDTETDKILLEMKKRGFNRSATIRNLLKNFRDNGYEIQKEQLPPDERMAIEIAFRQWKDGIVLNPTPELIESHLQAELQAPGTMRVADDAPPPGDDGKPAI